MGANRYPGTCATCSTEVPAQAGSLVNGPDGWEVHCSTCAPSAAPQRTSGTRERPTPTDEQQYAIDVFAEGESMIVEALAGTGKTSCAEMMGRSQPNRRGRLLAFNKAVIDEAKARFPSNVECSTAHSAAFRAVGHRYSDRLNSSRRVPSWQIAQQLGVKDLAVQVGGDNRRLSAPFLAGLVMGAVNRFCQSDDPTPATHHFRRVEGIDLPDQKGNRTYANNDAVRRELLPFAVKAWEDLCDVDGDLSYSHAHYLKLWALSDPQIPCDFLMADEAQDTSPVVGGILEAQRDCQLVLVGDRHQAINGWMGAVDAMSSFDVSARAALTRSFRFGPAIAAEANNLLAMLGADLRLVGAGPEDGRVGVVEEPSAILTRSNAAAVRTLIEMLAAGRRVHLVGGGQEVARFCDAAEELQLTGSTSHPDLACFDSWGAVRDYVEQDEQGEDLRLLVRLVDEFGAGTIVSALRQASRRADADVTASTAHRSKGLTMDSVRLASDFPDGSFFPSDDELMLLYVAMTRPRFGLDVSQVGFLRDTLPAVAASLPEPQRPAVDLEKRDVGGAGRLTDRPRWAHEQAS